MYGLFLETADGRIESIYSRNKGFDPKNADWTHPYPSRGKAFTSMDKSYDLLRDRGNPDKYKSIVMKNAQDEILETIPL